MNRFYFALLTVGLFLVFLVVSRIILPPAVSLPPVQMYLPFQLFSVLGLFFGFRKGAVGFVFFIFVLTTSLAVTNGFFGWCCFRSSGGYYIMEIIFGLPYFVAALFIKEHLIVFSILYFPLYFYLTRSAST